MNHYLITISLVLGTVCFGQKHESKVRPGIQLSAVFSELYENGITPALTLDFQHHQISLGPRFDFYRMVHGKQSYFDRYNSLTLDAAYRYFPIDEWNGIRPFAMLAVEYLYTKYQTAGTFGPDTNFQQSYGPIFDHSFEGNSERRYAYLNFYAGLGVEVGLWKELYVSLYGGPGISFAHSEWKITNTSTNETEHYSEMKWRRSNSVVWMGSAGVGYRF